MISSPFVTVLMPVYNGEPFLKEAIDSILHQTYKHFELIIIDDGSTDATENIVHCYTDERIRYERNKLNLKIIKTLNKGIALSKGKYIVRMDADDIALPNRLELQIDYMEQHTDVVLCGSSLNRFSESYSIIERRGGNDAIIRAKLLFDTAVNHPSAIIRNSILKEHHLEYPSDFLHTEDYALWYQLSQYGKVANLDDVLIRYRMHGNNLSMQHSRLQYENMNRMRMHILDDFLCKSKAVNRSNLIQQYKELLALSYISKREMVKMDQLLKAVIDINASSGIYDDMGLKKASAWFWFVVFTHENCYQYSWKMIWLFLLNKHSICHNLSKEYRKKLWVKSLIRWKKK